MLLDNYHKNLPDYYPYMYLDGYTPEQIMEAVHRTMEKEWGARKRQSATERSIEAQMERKLGDAVEKAMADIFKGWK